MDQILANHSAVLGLILLGLIHFGSKGLQIAVLLKQLREKPVAPGVAPDHLELRLAAFSREHDEKDKLRTEVMNTKLDGLQRTSSESLEYIRRVEDRLNNTTTRAQLFNPGGGQ